MRREEILSSPTLLSYLFRVALGKQLATTADNYRYWQLSGGEWGPEYDRRKTRHPFFHIQEMMITDYVAHHAPCKVLEFGCGTGRHLRNLAGIAGVECYGFDQSEAMIDAGFKWAPADWRESHVSVGGATDRLPYDDGAFDLVYTCEALLHTRPEDLAGRLAEITRVCSGHIVHIESPQTWTGYSPSCDGCWGHDFVAAYARHGLQCSVLPSGFRHQTPYRVALNESSVRWTWEPAMLRLYQQLDVSMEEGFAQVEAPALA
jgi:ubiquinone/menaquinone biosynthesis C-methylase UbiE